jgi:hypothetical protein
MITTLSANLEEDTLRDVQNLEKEIGCPILAFSFYDLEPAKLDEEKLAILQEYEKGRCICLLAVEP